MEIKEMLALRQLLTEVAIKTEGVYYLTKEERLALHHFEQDASRGEYYRLYLLQLAQEIGIEPEQLLYLQQLAEKRVRVID